MGLLCFSMMAIRGTHVQPDRVTRVLVNLLSTALTLLILSGCNALPNNADTGPATTLIGDDPLNSEGGPNRLSGQVSEEATVWRLGSLEGFCSAQYGGVEGGLVVDDVLLSTDALFDTADPTLSEAGGAVLEQLARRLASYEDVKRIELVGHADKRGSASKNYQLALGRAESVRAWLQNNLSEPIDMRVLSLGESQSSGPKFGHSLANDRRVDVRIIVAGTTGNSIDSTLCSLPSAPGQTAHGSALQVNANAVLSGGAMRNRLDPFRDELPLSPGDQLQLAIAGDEDLNGVYEVSIGGGIDIPLLGRLVVMGLTVPAVKAILADELVDQQLIRPDAVSVDAHIVEYAPIEVFVRGAVFNKGRVSINNAKAELLELRAIREGGDDGKGRLLSFALQQAGGVRPDADLSSIQILRNGKTIPVNLNGLVHGELVRDVPLVSGDEIVVASTGRFDKALVSPTQITPPGIRIFVSNTTTPVFGNASAHITKDETNVPYGTRVAQALTSINCVGGAAGVNAARRTILISKDYQTGQVAVTERSVQRLLREPNRLDVNPFLMPGDSLACFDADVSNIREIAKVFADLLSPLVAFSMIFGRF